MTDAPDDAVRVLVSSEGDTSDCTRTGSWRTT
jgi:hypothetical protein